MPGLGTSLGRGGATTNQMDVRFADAVFIMGSNMAECHPVSFRFVMQAKLAGAKIIHADPRFTRTSAMADIHAPLRAGTDIVFLGALIRYILEENKYFREYVVNYTNAATLINENYQDTEDLEGLFSGFRAESRSYDASTWGYDEPKKAEPSNQPKPVQDDAQSFSGRAGQLGGPLIGPTRRSSILDASSRSFVGTTPAIRPSSSSRSAGRSKETFLKVAETLTNASGPDRTSVICYAVGWTQHTTGVQMIRASTIVQLLLGNIGRPGGGILALRGHASIQGSTDIPTLYNLLPGYLNIPSALKSHETLAELHQDRDVADLATGSNFPNFIVSLLKAWYGEASTKENDWRLRLAPQDRRRPLAHADVRRDGRRSDQGVLRDGPEPRRRRPERRLSAQGSGEARLAGRQGPLRDRDRHLLEGQPRGPLRRPQARGRSPPRSSSSPPPRPPRWTAPTPTPSASSSGTTGPPTRPATPAPTSGSPSSSASGSRSSTPTATLDRDRPIQALTWDYIDPEENAGWRIKDEPSAASGPQGDERHVTWPTAEPVKGFGDLKADGSTACGAWIYSGVYAPTPQEPDGHNFAANRQGDDWVALGWGFAWPANRRILYNRASADPRGNPWPKEARLAKAHGKGEKGYVYWDADWQGPDPPDPARPSKAAGSASTSPTSRSPSRRPHRASPTASGSTSTTAPRPSS